MTEYEQQQMAEARYAAGRAEQALNFAASRWHEGKTRKAYKTLDFALAQLREAVRSAENALTCLDAEMVMSGGAS
jgi:hypothetical protein